MLKQSCLLLILVTALPACQQRSSGTSPSLPPKEEAPLPPPSLEEDSQEQAEAAPILPPDPEPIEEDNSQPGEAVADDSPNPNLPAFGRSLFDYLMVQNSTSGRTIEIPYPLTTLVQQIEARAHSRSVSALIPKGRSILRRANEQAPFANPRVVVGFENGWVPKYGRDQNHNTFTRIDGRLFIAYIAPSNRLEIISYNEALGRYEFQVVVDYRAGGNPKLHYASRNVCTSCHQNEGPLFAARDWTESNANWAVAQSIVHHVGFDYYQGFPIVDTVKTPYGVDNLDRSVRHASLVPSFQAAWNKGCQGTDEEQIRCRSQLVFSGLKRALTGHGSQRSPHWVHNWPSLAQTILGASSILPNPQQTYPFSYQPIPHWNLAGIESQILSYESTATIEDPLAKRSPLHKLDGEAHDFVHADGWYALTRFIAGEWTKADLNKLSQMLYGDLSRLHAACQQLAEENDRANVLTRSPLVFRFAGTKWSKASCAIWEVVKSRCVVQRINRTYRPRARKQAPTFPEWSTLISPRF